MYMTTCTPASILKASELVFAIIRLIVPLYVALDVYGATNCKWRAFGAFIGIAVLVSLVEIAFVWTMLKMYPCAFPRIA